MAKDIEKVLGRCDLPKDVTIQLRGEVANMSGRDSKFRARIAAGRGADLPGHGRAVPVASSIR